jgi:hypothetical protein
MLVINPKAQCNTCQRRIQVKQPDGTEASEKWVCPAYKGGIPHETTVKAKKCKHYVKDI